MSQKDHGIVYPLIFLSYFLQKKILLVFVFRFGTCKNFLKKTCLGAKKNDLLRDTFYVFMLQASILTLPLNDLSPICKGIVILLFGSKGAGSNHDR